MRLIVGLLAVNTILHVIVVARFGLRGHNQPFLVFALVYAALATAVYFSAPYALWAVLVMSVIGLIGLSVTFNKPAREKTLDKVIWVLDLATILYVGYLLWASKM